MSSFLIEEKSINQILSYLKDCFTNCQKVSFIESEIIIRVFDNYEFYLNRNLTDEDLTLLGRKFIDLNQSVYNFRYNNKYKSDCIDLKDYTFEHISYTLIQIYKSLTCFVYQCNEESFDKNKLYCFVKNELIHSIAELIIKSSNEYDKANWE